MLIDGHVAESVGLRPFGYITSIVVTIGLWLPVGSCHGRLLPGPPKAAIEGAGLFVRVNTNLSITGEAIAGHDTPAVRSVRNQ
jgi:hypothetical protein